MRLILRAYCISLNELKEIHEIHNDKILINNTKKIKYDDKI